MLFSLCLGAACMQVPLTPRADVTLRLRAGEATRSLLPDEQLISDLNLLIYTEEGLLEEQRFLSERLLIGGRTELELRCSLLRGVRYTIAVCANLGYALPALPLDQLRDWRYSLTYPDEYTHGMPMSHLTDCLVPLDTDLAIDLPLERAMARIDLQLDRSGLNPDVALTIESVHAGGCPASVSLFRESHALGADDVFSSGFFLDESQCQALNRRGDGGKSGIVPLYLLENCQGTLPEGGPACSWIELWASYHSLRWHTPPGEHLTYRFYIGEEEGRYDLVRNTVYHYTVRPEGDGLKTEGWHLDKDCLVEF